MSLKNISELAQWVGIFTDKPSNLNLIPRIRLVEGEKDSCRLSSDLHMHIHIHKQVNKCNYIYIMCVFVCVYIGVCVCVCVC